VQKKVLIFISLLFGILLSYLIFAEFPGAVSITSPVTLQNISGTFTIDVSIATLTDETNVSNVTFYADNGNGTLQTIGLNGTENLTSYSIVWTTTGEFGEGTNFTINVSAVYVNQSLNQSVDGYTIETYNSSEIVNVTVDNTGPTITQNAPLDLATTNTTDITFNFTAIDLIFTTIATCNLTLDPLNSSGGSVINTTTNVANGTEVILINSIETGTHSWNADCTDSFDTNNTDYSANISFGSGATAPQVTIDLLNNQRVSKTKFGAIDTVTIACTRLDDDGFNETIVSVLIPSLPDFLVIEKVTESAAINESRTLEVPFTDTRELGDYIAQCEVSDVAGNSNSTNISFTVEKKVKSGTSAFGNKDFVAPVAKVKVSKGSISDLGTLTTEGFSRMLQETAAMKFTVKGQEHTVTVKALGEKTVTLIIASSPFEVTLNAGEAQSVDVDKDDVNDLKITFHKEFGKYADMTVALLSEEEKQQEVQQKKTAEKTTAQTTKTAGGRLFTGLFVIIVIVILGYFLLRRKKR